MKYKYEIESNKVVAYCNYAGKRIQASATCCPDDAFDANYGMMLAAKRLDCKIQLKRYKRALARAQEAQVNLLVANAEFADKLEYLDKMDRRLMEVEFEYDELMADS